MTLWIHFSKILILSFPAVGMQISTRTSER
jgi:hypothetical protein